MLGRIQVERNDVLEFLGEAGSLLSLKVSLRCGFRPCARQMRRTLASLIPMAAAIERVLQRVALDGVCRVVLRMRSRTRCALIVGLRPGTKGVLCETRESEFEVSFPPARGLLRSDVQGGGDLFVLLADGGQQHDARSIQQTGRRLAAAHDGFELRAPNATGRAIRMGDVLSIVETSLGI